MQKRNFFNSGKHGQNIKKKSFGIDKKKKKKDKDKISASNAIHKSKNNKLLYIAFQGHRFTESIVFV